MRTPQPSDFDVIFEMGFDAWAEKGDSIDAHIERCRASKKYSLGQWFVKDVAGSPKAALICYENQFDLPKGWIGIGTVATLPAFRNQRLASTLIQEVMKHFEEKQKRGFILFSEVNPSLYERLGFQALPSELQQYPHSPCMIRPSSEIKDTFDVREISNAPRYF